MSSYRTKSNRVGSKAKVVVRGPRLTSKQARLMAVYPPRGLIRTGGRIPMQVGELKNFDVSRTNPVLSSAAGAQIFLLCVPGSGSAATSRVGRQIRMKSLQINLRLNYAGGMNGQSPIRLLIVYDRQANTGFPLGSDVLATDNIFQMRNLDNQFRFDILLDKIICGNFGAAGVAQYTSVFYKKYLKLNHKTQFNTSSTGTISDIETGSLLAFIYQDGNITTANPSANWYSRVRYTD